MEIKEKAHILAETIAEKKGRDIIVIDISEKSSFADYFVNATAGSDRQLGALVDFVKDKAAELDLTLKNSEGKAGGGWILVDLGDIVVNIFNSETREKYSLDKIWGDCNIEMIDD